MVGFSLRRRESGPRSQSSFRQYAGLAAFSFFTVLFSAIALVFNAALVFALYQGSLQFLPVWFSMVQLGQLILFVGPMLLLFLEWLLWDYLSVRFRTEK
jgi:hypothetical protein